MKKENFDVKKLCLAAAMAALYVGLDFLAVQISAPFGGTMKISVSGLPVIITAICAGPIAGMATGFVGAFIGQMITYGFTATTLLWVLPAVVRGALAGLLFIAFKKSCKPYILIIETVIGSLAVTLFNTLALYVDSKIFAYPFIVFGISLVNRIIAAVLTAVVFGLILPPIVKALRKII